MARLTRPWVLLPEPPLMGMTLAPVVSPANARLATLMRRLMLRTLSGRLHDLTIEVDDDVITLRGRCRTFHVKQVAQTIAMELSVGARIVNQIEVACPA